ncbi:MAG: hypothetical protein JWN15_1162, partial [Firmicutes bacterium]|nr:hypothetical protein [Bacillota bacterium]
FNIVDNWNHLGGLAGGLLAAAVIGVPQVAGRRLPRFHLARPMRAILAGALLLAAAAVVAGGVELPGPGRDLARGVNALAAGHPREAEPAIRRAAELQPDEPRIRYWLVWTYATAGDCQKAGVQLAELTRLLPDLPASDRQELDQLMKSCQSP